MSYISSFLFPFDAETLKKFKDNFDKTQNDKFIKNVTDLVDEVFKEIDEALATELDESYRDRLLRDIKANGFDRLEKIMEDFISIDWNF